MRSLVLLCVLGLACSADTPFFNGRDFDGWEFFPPETEAAFRVEDGMIVCSGEPIGYLTTKRKYEQFTLSFEWRFVRPAGLEDELKFPGNSGYLLFVDDHELWPKSLEIQGMNSTAGAIIPIRYAAKFISDDEARESVRRPVGEWNEMEIVVRSGTINVFLNGALISTVTEYGPKKGYIGFQSEGAEIHWRNINLVRH